MTAAADALMAIFGFKRVEGNQMKTDRELLELAAKAAGYEVWAGRGHQEDMFFVRMEKPDPTGKCSGREWNPLTDDGDALRLAVKLCLEIDVHHTGIAVRTPFGQKVLIAADEVKCGHAATRRAIVRAAAAIGEAMQ